MVTTNRASTKAVIPETQVWAHWKDVKQGEWPWKYFSPEEIACRGTGKLIVHKKAMDRLEAFRKDLGKPIILNSAYRSPEHNKAVGGEQNSYHMATREHDGEKVMAFDCSMANHEPNDFWAKAKKHGFNGRGDYPRQNFMHIDNGPTRSWTGRGQGKFPPAKVADAKPTPQFDEEKPALVTTQQSILKPEIIAPIAVAVGTSGIAPAVAGSFPLSVALGVSLVLFTIGFGIWMFTKNRNAIAVTAPGTGD